MDIEEVQQYKEYSHLNNHYLKINLTKTSLILIGFHTEPLDNILYLVNLNQEEIKQNSKYKNISLQKLYEKLIDLIEKNKYIITDDKNCMVLSIFEGDNFDITKDFQFFLIKSTEDQNKHYENAVKKIMMSLKKENTEMKNKLKALSTENKNNEKPKEDNPFIDEADKVKTEIAKSKQNSLSKSTREFKRRSTLGLNISTLANLDYNSYPSVELSNGSFNIIAGYGGNTYNGIKRNYNEDKLKIIIDQKLSKEVKTKKGEIINPKICYFAIYDGHGGDKCSKFLQENLHNYIFSSGYFPIYTIQAINEAYTKAEKDFFEKVVDPISDNINDPSGSCALTALILDEWCFIINLGDSRALYSFDSGQSLMQVTRDHKPNDPIEKERIEKAGGSVYKVNNVKINGKIVQIDEKDLPKGVTIPYRMNPGNIAVARSIGDYMVKIPALGGKENTLICQPCVNTFHITDKSDFILLGCDGIFDRLDNEQIFNKIWEYKKKGEVHNDIGALCGKITDGIIKYSMQKKSVDNVSVIFIAFKNFENKMKDPDFEYKNSTKVTTIKDKYDFSQNPK